MKENFRTEEFGDRKFRDGKFREEEESRNLLALKIGFCRERFLRKNRED